MDKLILRRAMKNILQMSSIQSLFVGYFEQLFVECDEFSYEMEGQPEITGIVRWKVGLSCQFNNFQMIHLYDFNGKLPGGKKCSENLSLLFWINRQLSKTDACEFKPQQGRSHYRSMREGLGYFFCPGFTENESP